MEIPASHSPKYELPYVVLSFSNQVVSFFYLFETNIIMNTFNSITRFNTRYSLCHCSLFQTIIPRSQFGFLQPKSLPHYCYLLLHSDSSNDSVDLLTKTTRKHEIHNEMECCNTIWCASGIKSHYFINDKLTETRQQPYLGWNHSHETVTVEMKSSCTNSQNEPLES